MTKKNFKRLAECLRLYAKPFMTETKYDELLHRIGFTLADVNSQFNMTKWKAACNDEPAAKPLGISQATPSSDEIDKMLGGIGLRRGINP